MKFMTSHILGISSSQLTLTPSFFRGVGQPPTYFWGDEHPPAIVDLRPTARGTISLDTIARRRKSEILISKSFPYISLLFGSTVHLFMQHVFNITTL